MQGSTNCNDDGYYLEILQASIFCIDIIILFDLILFNIYFII